jgi:hypothetical protein
MQFYGTRYRHDMPGTLPIHSNLSSPGSVDPSCVLGFSFCGRYRSGMHLRLLEFLYHCGRRRRIRTSPYFSWKNSNLERSVSTRSFLTCAGRKAKQGDSWPVALPLVTTRHIPSITASNTYRSAEPQLLSSTAHASCRAECPYEASRRDRRGHISERGRRCLLLPAACCSSPSYTPRSHVSPANYIQTTQVTSLRCP